MSVKESGRKDDQNKPDLTDIPKEAMWEMGKAFTYGQKKYGKNNYRNGMAISRQLAAAVRHIYQHLDGETIDPETGTTTHLGHAMASIAMAIYNLQNNPHLDDRFDADKKKHTLMRDRVVPASETTDISPTVSEWKDPLEFHEPYCGKLIYSGIKKNEST